MGYAARTRTEAVSANDRGDALVAARLMDGYSSECSARYASTISAVTSRLGCAAYQHPKNETC